ncbi:MAG: D-threitol dehydrogenase [Lachnospiraceae bacterium]|nr:D-threitol dehydrogenase [Lachnospiraceae bacterium]
MNEYKGFDENLSLNGKIALITGAASGIALATSQMMTRKGARVIMADRNSKVVEEAEKIPGAIPIILDITDYAAIEAAVERVVCEVGNIDILCNIAGLGSGTPVTQIPHEEFDQVLKVNLNAAFYMSQIVGKQMIAAGKGGRIISMASQAGIVAIDGHVAYSSSKAGLMAMTRDLALEWGKYGITANTVAPTVVMTPMAKDYWVGERGEAHLAQIPVGRFAEMDEIAMAVCYLASDAAAMINGANLVVDGGFTIG